MVPVEVFALIVLARESSSMLFSTYLKLVTRPVVGDTVVVLGTEMPVTKVLLSEQSITVTLGPVYFDTQKEQLAFWRRLEATVDPLKD